jgi:CRP-like cAMP-binding protein
MQFPQIATALLRILSRRLRSADELADALARRPPR